MGLDNEREGARSRASRHPVKHVLSGFDINEAEQVQRG